MDKSLSKYIYSHSIWGRTPVITAFGSQKDHLELRSAEPSHKEGRRKSKIVVHHCFYGCDEDQKQLWEKKVFTSAYSHHEKPGRNLQTGSEAQAIEDAIYRLFLDNQDDLPAQGWSTEMLRPI